MSLDAHEGVHEAVHEGVSDGSTLPGVNRPACEGERSAVDRKGGDSVTRVEAGGSLALGRARRSRSRENVPIAIAEESTARDRSVYSRYVLRTGLAGREKATSC